MAAVMMQLAALQAQVQSLTAQNAELRKLVDDSKFSQLFDEEVPEHDAENAGEAAAGAAAPKAPAMPPSFAMTPERRGWTQQGQADSDAYTPWIAGGLPSAAPAQEDSRTAGGLPSAAPANAGSQHGANQANPSRWASLESPQLEEPWRASCEQDASIRTSAGRGRAELQALFRTSTVRRILDDLSKQKEFQMPKNRTHRDLLLADDWRTECGEIYSPPRIT